MRAREAAPPNRSWNRSRRSRVEAPTRGRGGHSRPRLQEQRITHHKPIKLESVDSVYLSPRRPPTPPWLTNRRAMEETSSTGHTFEFEPERQARQFVRQRCRLARGNPR